MGNCIKIGFLSLIIVGCSFSEPQDIREDQVTSEEEQLVGLWQYETIEINSISYQFANPDNEPTFQRSQSRRLTRRFIRYNADKTYEVLWFEPFGAYQLGTDDEQNWQPSFGSWSISDSGRLIHNEFSAYETSYTFIASQSKLTKVTRRVMSSSNGGQWAVGDTVNFVEEFVKIEE